MKLTENFYLSEFLHSENAERIGGDILAAQQNPSPEVIANLKRQAERIWQPCRNALGVSFKISSGYRCKELNALTPGSSETSQHVLAEAADVQVSESFCSEKNPQLIAMKAAIESITGKPVRKDVNASFYLFAYICLNLEKLDIDQVIHEFGSNGKPAWVHGSTSERQNKREILFKRSGQKYDFLSVYEALMLGC